MIQMLNIKDAIRLYAMLKDLVPDHEIDDDYLEFVGEIIHNIKESGRQEIFGECILLMNPKMDVEKLSEMKPLDVVELFMEGLAKNKFFSLKKFCEALGYGG